MRYQVLVVDYDGTLAHDGKVDDTTLAALERLLATGRKLVLATGRELHELLPLLPQITLFARVVAENGALLYRPETREEKDLCKPPPENLVNRLKEKGVAPLSVGRSILATWRPHETAVLEAIRDLGLDYQVIFNKDAVMALPAGVNKAAGLTAALHELGLSPHEAVGIGDAENDHAFLALCECAVAVANALPSLKERADWVTHGERGAGVAELIDELVENDLKTIEGRLNRHQLLLGHAADGSEVSLPCYGQSVLVAGPSGSGKSTAATSILERLIEHKYQYCIIDPEGDYENLKEAVTLGAYRQGPTVDEVLQVLAQPEQNAVVNMVGLKVADRPSFFLTLLPRLQEMRARTGRPHWLLIDEAHHLLPVSWEPGADVLHDLKRTLFITVHPNQVTRAAMESVDVILAVGKDPDDTVEQFRTALGETAVNEKPVELGDGEVLFWSRLTKKMVPVKLVPSKLERRRHTRKYAEGELPPERSFYFRGAEGKLNLRAQNLFAFLELADGVDDDTWKFHLAAGDYSRWFRERIKDDILATEAAALETAPEESPRAGRERMREIVEKHYTLPDKPPLPMPGTDAAAKNE